MVDVAVRVGDEEWEKCNGEAGEGIEVQGRSLGS